MRTDVKMKIDRLTDKQRLAYRKYLIMILEYEKDIPRGVYNEIKEVITYVEQKLNQNNMDLNTEVSKSDMQKVGKYVGGISGTSSPSYQEEAQDDDFSFKIGCGAIIVMLIYTFFQWLGGVITNLWDQGIIQIILAVLGVGAVGFAGYKLWENEFFSKIKVYFQKINLISEKKRKNAEKSKVNIKVKNNKNNSSKENNVNKKSVRILATATIITMLSIGYNVVDKNTFNGKKVSLFKNGRYNEEQNHPNYDFNDLLIIGKSSSSSEILNRLDISLEEDLEYLIKPSYYSVNDDALKELCSESMEEVGNYINTQKFDGEEKYFHFDRELYFYQSGFVTEVVNLFTDYRNALIYYASKGDYQQFIDVFCYFVVDCNKLIKEDMVYQLGDPLCQCSYRFSDLNELDKKVILILCDSILNVGVDYNVNYQDNKGTNLVYVRELKNFVLNELNSLQEADDYVYVKHGYLYN